MALCVSRSRALSASRLRVREITSGSCCGSVVAVRVEIQLAYDARADW